VKQLEAALNVSSFEQVNRSPVGCVCGHGGLLAILEAVKGYFASCHKLSNWEL
jgi:hypothetical protein